MKRISHLQGCSPGKLGRAILVREEPHFIACNSLTLILSGRVNKTSKVVEKMAPGYSLSLEPSFNGPENVLFPVFGTLITSQAGLMRSTLREGLCPRSHSEWGSQPEPVTRIPASSGLSQTILGHTMITSPPPPAGQCSAFRHGKYVHPEESLQVHF